MAYMQEGLPKRSTIDEGDTYIWKLPFRNLLKPVRPIHLKGLNQKFRTPKPPKIEK